MCKMQEFVSQPSDKADGTYVVARYNYTINDYVPIKGEVYRTEEEAKKRAHELNQSILMDDSDLIK